MIMDNQIKEKPMCEKCKKVPALVYYRTIILCGDCSLEVAKKENQKLRELYLDG